MNKTDLIYGLLQMLLKETESMNLVQAAPSNKTSPFIGLNCMIRTYSAGVHFGKLVRKIDQNVILEDAYRVYSWAGACSLSQLATEGSKKRSECKISVSVPNIELDQAIEIVPMSEHAWENLTGGEIWKS